MRMMLRISVPTIEGNKALKDGSMEKFIEHSLSELKPEATLRDIVEQAFEAGVHCVLGQQGEEEDAEESEEDAVLSRMLLRSMIAESAAKRLMQFETLSPAIVGTLIERAAREAEAGAAH